MNRLRGHVPPPPGRVLLTVLLMLVGGTLDGATVGMLMPLLGILSGSKDSLATIGSVFPLLLDLSKSQQVTVLAGGLLLLVVAKNAASQGALVSASRLRADALIELRRKLLDRVLHAPPATLERHTSGEIVAALVSEATRVNRSLEYAIVFVQRIVIVLGYLVAVVVLSWQLTLATALLGVALAGVSLAVGKRALRLGRELAGAGVELGRQVSETVGGLRVVRTTASERDRARSFDHWNRVQANAEAEVGASQAIAFGVGETLGVAGAMGLTAIAYTVWLAPGTMDVSRFLAFSFGLMRLLPALNQGYSMGTAVTSLTGSIERTLRWLELPSYPERPFGARVLREITSGITFENVTFTYGDGGQGVRDVSFHLPAGQTLAILGSSGSGKTTLVNLLLRLRQPVGGRILIDGIDHWEFSAGDFHRCVALVDQDPFLFNGTLAENVAFGADWVSRQDVSSALERVQLGEFVAGLPQGLDTIVGERGATMSGGQRQRLAIARAIVRDPKLLVLDEPTSALDAETEREVVLAIEAARAGRTTIIISHRPTTLERADRTLLMRGGVLMAAEEKKREEVAVGRA